MTAKKKRSKEISFVTNKIKWENNKAFDKAFVKLEAEPFKNAQMKTPNKDKKIYNKKENGKNDTGRPEKHTLQFAIDELTWMWEYLNNRVEVKGLPPSNTVLFMSELTLMRDYSIQRVSEWKKNYKENNEFSELVEKVLSFLEIRLVKAGLANKANARMVVLTLKHHYNYKEIQHHDHKSDGEKITLTDADLDKRIADYQRKMGAASTTEGQEKKAG